MPHFFGLGRGRVSEAEGRRVDRVAREHGAYFICATIPGAGPRYWFEIESLGFPFDDRRARAVLEAVGRVKTKAEAGVR